MLIGDNVRQTQHKQIFQANEDFLDRKDMDKHLESLTDAVHDNDNEKLENILKASIHGFIPEKEIVDIIHMHNKN